MKKYNEVYDALKEKISRGEYPPGQKLPSKRRLSDIYGVSLITVEHALGMLFDEGLVSSVPRSGYFVCPHSALSAPQGGAVFSPLSERAVPSGASFEYSLWFKTVRSVMSRRGEELFSPCPVEGVCALRNAIAEYLGRCRSLPADPRRIIIGSGAEALYSMIVSILGRDRVYGIEDPSYPRIRAAYERAGASVCPLRMGEDGIVGEELQKKDFSVLHVTPFHSFPTGVTTSVEKKREYLAWARGGGVLVEDDFDSEFYTPGHPVVPVYRMDPDRVIYLNTFSKSLSPAIRIGYMILPEEYLPRFRELYEPFSCSVPVMDQYVLAEFLGNGSFERHLGRLRRRMKNGG